MTFLDPADMITGSPLPGWSGRFFHSENMTFAHWTIDPDAADLHEHHHPQEEVWNVIEGEALLVVDGDQRRLGPGQIAIVPPNISHSVSVVGPCRAIIVDYPIRLDLPGVDRPLGALGGDGDARRLPDLPPRTGDRAGADSSDSWK